MNLSILRKCLWRWGNVAFITVVLSAFIIATPQADRPVISWTPPPARLKVKTPFAPRPSEGGNIFKGDADRWLAVAATNLEAGNREPVADAVVTEYVSRVGKNLGAYSAAPTKSYEFIVLDDQEADSYTAGGGIVYITLGMLRMVESEDELAGLLAHEIAHDAFHHAATTVTRQLFWMTGVTKVNTPDEVESALRALYQEYRRKPLAEIAESLIGFSRFHELEADRAAFYTIYKAGYNPRGLATVLKRLESKNKKELGKDYPTHQLVKLLLGSHPLTAQRSLALSWESNFVKMPPKDSRCSSPAFEVMKVRVAQPWVIEKSETNRVGPHSGS
jgi:predicted Zn-dependent protease